MNRPPVRLEAVSNAGRLRSDARGLEMSVADVASLLDRLALAAPSEAARQAFQRASRALRQAQPGSPRRFSERDRRDLLEADQLLAAGKAGTFHRACMMVASKYDGDERKIRSIAERMERRRRAMKIVST
jgi:hypothetical protein